MYVMKTNKFIKWVGLAGFAGMVTLTMIFPLSNCKKDTETITKTETVTVHDTLKGKAIMGLATYTDYSGASAVAKGAVVSLHLGSTAIGTVVSSTYADASGHFMFPYLLPGAYYITAKYNTDNKNYKVDFGINFSTNPGYAVTLSSTDFIQNIALVNMGASGTAKIALDTITANQSFRHATMEAHSKVGFGFLDRGNSTTLSGGFNVFKLTKFAFDEANPSNIVIDGYVLLSTVNTFEPARDALKAGCVRKTLCVDTLNATTPLAITDTARFYSVSVEKYGDGYLCHGKLKSFYKHPTGGAYPADTTGGFAGPFNQMITKDVDLYFTYLGKNKMGTPASYNWFFVFEGEFTIYPKKDFYVTSAHFDNGPVKVSCHVQIQGDKNREY